MPRFDDSKFSEKLLEVKRHEEEVLMKALALKYGHQYILLLGTTINTDALRMISEDVARDAELLLFERAGNKLSIAIRNPNKPEAKKILAEFTERHFILTVYMCSRASLEYGWARYHDIKAALANEKGVLAIGESTIEDISTHTKTVKDVADRLSAINKTVHAHQISDVLEVILGGAIALNASDVHIEPEESAVRLRFRLDGVLLDIVDISTELYMLLRSRLKLLSGLILNKTKEAQDGRFTIDLGGSELDIRSSIIPGAYGESIVMRLLDPKSTSKTIDDLGIFGPLRTVIEAEILRPNGMIITTGPTGSGKTTALYALLRYIHKPEVKIITLEDPIEYKLQGIVQTQVTKTYSFAEGLRAILRQDPDILLVGEIRDGEVAETALHAALTGHLVFSTLHTNSAAGAFPRLIDLGIDAKMIGSAINLVLGQRLVRKLCPVCRKRRVLTADEYALIKQVLVTPYAELTITASSEVYDAIGCDACSGTGYKGRIGVYEGIRVDKAVSDIVLTDSREDSIRAVSVAQKIPTMQEDGLMKVLKGITSLSELARVVDLKN